MRLLRLEADCSFSLVQFSREKIPPYAILSHTWGKAQNDEVTFKDLLDGTGIDKHGFKKLQFCAKQSKADGLHYFWVDTCCIDKSNNHELTTAINSMFRWYANAAKCYVYLTDVSLYPRKSKARGVDWELAFRKSRWFTRGWTLQELLAPKTVEFFSRDGIRLGDKRTLQHSIHQITSIANEVLEGCDLSGYSTDAILRWTENRQTTEEEDMAYCLMGIFGVFMSLIYAEGYENAMMRLLKKISESGRKDVQPSTATEILSYSLSFKQYLRSVPGFSSLATFAQAESNLWAVFVTVSCCVSFYWIVMSISLYLNRLLYHKLASCSNKLRATASISRLSRIMRKLSTLLACYILLVGIAWCSALTPLHLITPRHVDIWKPYIDFLPLQFSGELESLVFTEDSLISFTWLQSLPSGTKQFSFGVPKPRNRAFVQRSSTMPLIERKFRNKSNRFDARVVLYGLGGTGKTQCALEYGYRARDQKTYSSIFWVSGDPKQFIEDYHQIASQANLTTSRLDEQQSMEAVRSWLESRRGRSKPWLLVVDGLDDVDSPVFQHLPKYGGQILMTSRLEAVVLRFANLNDGIHLSRMDHKEAKQLFAQLTSLDEVQDSRDVDQLLEELERLPLAILQAATFIRKIQSSQAQPVLWYLGRFKESVAGQQDLLSRFRKTLYIDSDASSSVMTTWKITFDYLASTHPNSAALFQMMVYLLPLQIPAHIFHVEMFGKDEHFWNTAAKQNMPSFMFNKIDVEEALVTLNAFSFISYSSDRSHFQIHRLVRLAMLVELRHTGALQPFNSISLLLAFAFPEPQLSNIMDCAKLYPHIEELLSSSKLVETKDPEAVSFRVSLMVRSMVYLRLHGRTNEALQLGSRVQEEKQSMARICAPIESDVGLQVFHEASRIYNDLESYGLAKDFGQLEYDTLLNAYGETDPRTLQSLNHLTWIETLPEGDHQKAKVTFERIIQLTDSPDLRTINIEAKRGLSMLLRDLNQASQAFKLFAEAVKATEEMYGDQSVEFAMGLADLADLQWSDTINQRLEAGANKHRALGILQKHLGDEHQMVLQTAWKLGVFIIQFDHSRLDYAEGLFRKIIETPVKFVLNAGMDPMEMLDCLATVLDFKGNAQALEEAVCLTRAVLMGFRQHKGGDHPRTSQAQADSKRIEDKWRKAIKGQKRPPRESRWLQEIQALGSYDPRRTC